MNQNTEESGAVCWHGRNAGSFNFLWNTVGRCFSRETETSLRSLVFFLLRVSPRQCACRSGQPARQMKNLVRHWLTAVRCSTAGLSAFCRCPITGPVRCATTGLSSVDQSAFCRCPITGQKLAFLFAKIN